jgi:hypothetical protein
MLVRYQVLVLLFFYSCKEHEGEINTDVCKKRLYHSQYHNNIESKESILQAVTQVAAIVNCVDILRQKLESEIGGKNISPGTALSFVLGGSIFIFFLRCNITLDQKQLVTLNTYQKDTKCP